MLKTENAKRVYDGFVRLTAEYGDVNEQQEYNERDNTTFTTVEMKLSRSEALELYYKAQGVAYDLNLRFTEIRGVNPHKLNVGLAYMVILEDGSRRNAILDIFQDEEENICHIEAHLVEIG
jgi:hypothetical protein